ncbi:eyes absent homolog 4-like isoform X2 [Zophobas morio]|uniref:eyes absent homolog 4-like isoform X2 n=1 Tax=Zophobas morio TaxID=2755281 RepID=UPI0030839EFA
MSENLPPLDFGDLNHEVRIWDLDETLIILSSLLTTQFSAAHKESSTLCNYLGREMMKFLFIILEEFFAFKELEDHNITNFENLDYTNTIDNTSCLPDPVKKNVQELYIRNKEFYDNNRNYIQFEFVPEEIRTPLSAVYEEIDSLSSSWLSISYLILEKSQTCTNVTNLVVTSSHILGALAKLLLFKLSPFFPAQNVYSSSDESWPVLSILFQNLAIKLATLLLEMEKKKKRQLQRWGYTLLKLTVCFN